MIFVGFLVGFITVLCIGNYFRAKRAQERQRQRRLAKIAAASSNHGAPHAPIASQRSPAATITTNPNSVYSSGSDAHHHHFSSMGGVLGGVGDGSSVGNTGTYEAPSQNINSGIRV